jgi:hypothetical protein
VSLSKVLILGGYGNFGKRIARLLTRNNIPVIVAGRDAGKAKILARTLPRGLAEIAIFDVKQALPAQLKALAPAIVINTCGPFQTSDYAAAETCIDYGVHYIDLADGRDFVTGIRSLDGRAKASKVAVISGASTVPGLTSAVIEHFLPRFSAIDSLDFGIAPGQKAERGLATTQAILGYVGKKLKRCAGYETRYGWQDLHRQQYPEIGHRLMANCDIPDLDLLPEKYGIRKIRFAAGMENPLAHLGLWGLSWVVRAGFPVDLPKYSAALLAVSNCFDFFGSADGGMHVILQGKDKSSDPISAKWFIVALDGDGPYIPTIPSVVLTVKILAGQFRATGAMPCVRLVSLEEYLHELRDFNVKTYESTSAPGTA